jgi:hypothetical protein
MFSFGHQCEKVLKMKKVLIILISIMCSGSVLFGQNTEFDSRLLKKYSVKDLNKIEKEDPLEIKFLTYCLDNAFYIGEYPTEKDGKFEINGELEIQDLNNINLYQFDIEIQEGKNQMFSVNNKTKLLIVYDSKFLEEKFNKAK